MLVGVYHFIVGDKFRFGHIEGCEWKALGNGCKQRAEAPPS